ncbi:family 2A encapsulin nanocompartment cargo protein cysteine desulfurase [Mycobacterium sp. DL592]|uniref:family 2A encapsulin nanocompartment cargo protein cysteine desulfurase n=1 Tax=Mycobacterium sp. DL592 TaxID=2675524 RepID=UPI001FB9993B|nr:family 2A encapsulin nanocompartment cargo protein cysteine desulfurase [Mycobacterium sp. DL592]
MATQLFSTGTIPGNDSPPQMVPPAPRGEVPDTTSAASYAQSGVGSQTHLAPAAVTPPPSLAVPAPSSPGPEPIPPGSVPVAPRGSAPDLTSGTSAGHAGSGLVSAFNPFNLGEFTVPDGILPTVPGVLAGAAPTVPVAPRGSVPGFPHEVPGIPDLSFLSAPELTSAPTGDEANYYFTSAAPELAEPVPQIPDKHEIFDVHAIRADFPILHETVNGKPLIWFDNAATTQKPQAVIDRLAYFYAHENSNIHRAAHELAARATDAYEEARDTVRRFIGAPKSEQIIFVRGTTEAINLVAKAWGGKHLKPGDEIVITNLEHHANIVPWQMIAQQTGAILKVAPVDDAGNLLLSEFEDLLGPRTKLVSATQVSNALGTVTPVEKIVELGHRYGARVLIDAAQSVPHIPIDVSETGADFLVFSGHKIFGPTGIGVLYGTEEALAETPPWQGGGNMIADVTIERSIYQGLPNKFEAGTGNIADAVGLGEALRYVEKIGIDRIAAYEHALLEYATPRLAAIPGVRLIGTADEKASVLSFVLAGHDPIEIGKALNTEGIAVRAGHHCAQPILRRMGVETTVRPSFAFYNTYDEIDIFIDAVRRIAEGAVNVG